MEKGIKFIVTDQKIIEQCHGIIQGMSGSPIIQNNKLIGCVTHASKSEILEDYLFSHKRQNYYFFLSHL